MTYLVRHIGLLLCSRRYVPCRAQQYVGTFCIEQFMPYLVHHVGHEEINFESMGKTLYKPSTGVKYG